MGWYGDYSSPEAVQAEIVSEYGSKIVGATFLEKNPFDNQAVLWAVIEFTPRGETEKQRIIALWLIEKDNTTRAGSIWMYKPMDESMHPYYYGCPAYMLNEVPMEKYPKTTNAEWRKMWKKKNPLFVNFVKEMNK